MHFVVLIINTYDATSISKGLIQMKNAIKNIHAYEILDSRGNPTIETTVVLGNGISGTASVPSGASVGRYEAVELRDGDKARYNGKGVIKAVDHANGEIAKALAGIDADDQLKVDQTMIDLDGTSNKARLGANAILAVSLAIARASANSTGIPLYKSITKTDTTILPIPMMNVLNGGVHASNNVDIQEFMIIPVGSGSFEEGLRCCAEVYSSLKKTLKGKGLSTAVGDEGGFAPDLGEDAEALEILMKASEMAGYIPGKDVAYAVDAAASEWYSDEGNYVLSKRGKQYSRMGLVEYWETLVGKYPIVSLEDGMAQDDYEGWGMLTSKLGGKIQLVGDDLFVTNTERIRQGINKGIANSVLIKLNQIGTLSEALEAIKLAHSSGYSTVVSHRSGETEDAFIADFTAAAGCGQIKSGAPARGERTAKYNRLLRIAHETGKDAQYPGARSIKNYLKG